MEAPPAVDAEEQAVVPSAAAASIGASAGQIEVVARHALLGVEIKVLLPKHAKFKHVKKAIAKCFDSNEILERGQLMRKVGRVYSAYKDERRVDDVRHVLVSRVDLGAPQGARLEASLSDGEITAEEAEEEKEGPGEEEKAGNNGAARRPARSSASQGAAASAALISPVLLSAAAPPEAVPPRAVAEVGVRQPAAKVAAGALAASVPGAAGARAGGLARKQVISLQKELYEGFKDTGFKRELAALEKTRGASTSPAEFLQKRQLLLLSVQRKILPKYGFEGTLEGVYEMMGAMGPFVNDAEFKQLNTRINKLIGVDSPPETWGTLASHCQQSAADAGTSSAQAAGGGKLDGDAGLANGAALPRSQPPPTLEPWPPGRRPPLGLSVAGSWNNFTPMQMRWERGLFLFPLTVGPLGWERFQLLQNGRWEDTIYPGTPDASHLEEHAICGPDDKGHDMNWLIGKFTEEEAKPGTQFAILVAIDQRARVQLVTWKPF